MPVSAVDVIRPAFDHTVRQLFKPFRLGQWVRLAFTGLLAGELGTSGGCSFQIPWRPPNRSDQFLGQVLIPRTGLWFVAIVLLALLALVLVIALITSAAGCDSCCSTAWSRRSATSAGIGRNAALPHSVTLHFSCFSLWRCSVDLHFLGVSPRSSRSAPGGCEIPASI